MPKGDYIQQNDDAFNTQQQTFKLNIGSYFAVLGLSSGQVTAQAADAAYFDYSLKSLKTMTNGAQQWTAWKNLERAGGTPPVSGAPVAPVFPTLVAPVAPGIEVRFRALVQLIKASPNYNSAIGQPLGIEGAEQTGPDLTTLQPVIDAVISGNHVNVKWGWGGNSAYLDMCELQVDRGDGKGYVLLAYDTTPNYTDTQSSPHQPNGLTARSTAWATVRWACGASR